MLTGLSPLARALAGSRRNLLINGGFDNDTANWPASVATGSPTFTSVGGVGRITLPGTGVGVYAQGFATVIGRTYRVRGNLLGATGTVSFYLCRKADEANPATNIVQFKSGAGSFDTTFTATAATSYVSCQANLNTAGTADFDDLSVMEV